MKRTTLVVGLLCLLPLEGCVTETVNVTAGPPEYVDYSPGFTGATQGYDGYGNYDDGYGPSFWNPRYYFYSNYHEAYPGVY